MRRTLPIVASTLLALAAALPAAAQQGARPDRHAPRSLLIVHVVDEKGAPLRGAFVTVAGLDHGSNTDETGEARFGNVPQGNRLVEVRRQGYGFRRVAADFAGGDTVRRQIAMTPAPLELEGLTVTTWGRSMRLRSNGFYDRQRRGFGAFMTRQRLDEIRPAHTIDAFRYMRGFLVRPVGPYDVVEGTRGGGLQGCIPAVYIDGMQMFIHEIRDQAQALDMVPPDDIEAIEAYQGPASIPAEYNPLGNACGVLLIWTRR